MPRDKRKLPQAEAGAVSGAPRAKADDEAAAVVGAAGAASVVPAAQPVPAGPIGDGE